MQIIWTVIIAVFGLVVGSFLNVVINRLKLGQSVNGRSHCPKCKRVLRAIDLVPVLSFFFLRGRCRYCKTAISWQYPAVELATMTSFLLVAANNATDTWLSVAFQLVFVSILIVIAVYDLKHFLILDKVVFPAAALGIVYAIYQNMFWSGLLGVVIISGFFFLQYLASKGKWIGLGDVKLGLFLGWIVGWSGSIVLLMVAYCVGAVVGGYLIGTGKKQLASKVPFGLFLAGSAIITLVYGQAIADWYLHLIGFGVGL